MFEEVLWKIAMHSAQVKSQEEDGTLQCVAVVVPQPILHLLALGRCPAGVQVVATVFYMVA